MWFEQITGFREESPEQVRDNLSAENGVLTSHVNGKKYAYGRLETPFLGELRQRANAQDIPAGKISLNEVVGDIQQLHLDSSNADSLFQVASQFNLLEMISPSITPEHGVDGYEYDKTQGPACAIAAGAGTIYRNYFAEVNGMVGQTADNQIDCLSDIGAALDNSDNQLWQMRNGYALASKEGLEAINKIINEAADPEIDEIKGLLRIGIQWNTDVTLNDAKHSVSQVYCSALPVAYSRLSSGLWSKFARLILEASYEATLCAGILNYAKTGNNKVYLTLLGGGAFGNEREWIISAIARALNLYKDADLQVFIVSYGCSNQDVQELVNSF